MLNQMDTHTHTHISSCILQLSEISMHCGWGGVVVLQFIESEMFYYISCKMFFAIKISSAN